MTKEEIIKKYSGLENKIIENPIEYKTEYIKIIENLKKDLEPFKGDYILDFNFILTLSFLSNLDVSGELAKHLDPNYIENLKRLKEERKLNLFKTIGKNIPYESSQLIKLEK